MSGGQMMSRHAIVSKSPVFCALYFSDSESLTTGLKHFFPILFCWKTEELRLSVELLQ